MQPNIIRPYNPIVLFNIIPMYRPGLQDVYEYGRSEGYVNGVWKAAYTIPTLACRIKQNTFYKNTEGLAGDGLTGMDVLYVLASDGGDSDFATINWKNPATFQITKVNSPNYTNKTGFASNGTSSYLNTNWKLSNGVAFTQNNATVVYAGGFSANSMMGGISGTGGVQWRDFGAADRGGVNCTPGGFAVDIFTTGNNFYMQDRIDGTNTRVVKGGGAKTSIAVASIVLQVIDQYICALNTSGVAGSYNTQRALLFGAGSSSINNNATFNTNWNTYFTSL